MEKEKKSVIEILDCLLIKREIAQEVYEYLKKAVNNYHEVSALKSGLLAEDEDGYPDPFKLHGERKAFDGKVIKLTAQEFDDLAENYAFKHDRDRFREVLHRRDEWYATQPAKTYQNWLGQTVMWLQKNKGKFNE